jgi:hypothetical protein
MCSAVQPFLILAVGDRGTLSGAQLALASTRAHMHAHSTHILFTRAHTRTCMGHAQAQVLLKNVGGVLPLQASGVDVVLLRGSAADSVGRLSGAWTINWQGDQAYRQRGEGACM